MLALIIINTWYIHRLELQISVMADLTALKANKSSLYIYLN